MECPDPPNDVFYKRRNVVKYANYKIADYLMKKCCMDKMDNGQTYSMISAKYSKFTVDVMGL